MVGFAKRTEPGRPEKPARPRRRQAARHMSSCPQREPQTAGIKAMRIIGALIVVSMLASHAAVADVKRHASIPEPLQGSWAVKCDDCKPDDQLVIIGVG